MSDEGGPRAVLLTGEYGVGKTSLAEELAESLEAAGAPYAALDLDWLEWFDSGPRPDVVYHPVLLKNCVAVVGNYLDAGCRYFVLAGSVRDRGELDGLRAAVEMPVTVVRLSVPLEEIESRLTSDVTTARRQDCARRAAGWRTPGERASRTSRSPTTGRSARLRSRCSSGSDGPGLALRSHEPLRMSP
jgi:hypothetical protein